MNGTGKYYALVGKCYFKPWVVKIEIFLTKTDATDCDENQSCQFGVSTASHLAHFFSLDHYPAVGSCGRRN